MFSAGVTHRSVAEWSMIMQNRIVVSKRYAMCVPAEDPRSVFRHIYNGVDYTVEDFMDPDTPSSDDDNPDWVYSVSAKATSEDIARLLKLTAQVKDIQEEIDKIKADVMQDAEIALSGTAYRSYAVETPVGSVDVVNKTNVDVLMASSLTAALNDAAQEMVTPKPATYAVSSALSQVLAALETDTLGEVLPSVFINRLAENLGDGNLVFSKTSKVLKKTYTANVKVFINTFGLSEEDSEDYAERYGRTLNYELFCKLAVSAGVNTEDPEAVEAFKQRLRAAVVVRQTLALTIKVR